MSRVASDISPMNCKWISWEENLPVCTRPPAPRHCVTEGECALCSFWNDDVVPHAAPLARARSVPPAPHAGAVASPDPLNPETCPRCSSHDVVLVHQDAVVQSFTCAMCHQRWLATRPWPLLRESRSHGPDGNGRT